MAISRVGVDAGEADGSAWVFDEPSGVQVGDLLVLQVGWTFQAANDVAWTFPAVPAGWTLVSSQLAQSLGASAGRRWGMRVYTKVGDGTEFPLSIDGTSGVYRPNGAVIAYRSPGTMTVGDWSNEAQVGTPATTTAGTLEATGDARLLSIMQQSGLPVEGQVPTLHTANGVTVFHTYDEVNLFSDNRAASFADREIASAGTVDVPVWNADTNASREWFVVHMVISLVDPPTPRRGPFIGLRVN